MAMSADCVIAEPDHIVPVGVIPPDAVVTPFCCVNYIIDRSN
jgi:acetate CoA/acetoacetate CoA-transferase alpha subunit